MKNNKTNLINVISKWIADFKTENGYEDNRYFPARVDHGYTAQRRRAGKLTSADNLTDVDLILKLIHEQGDVCPMCGLGFNTIGRSNDDGYTWEIAHIKSPQSGGKLNFKNIQCLHGSCNKLLGRENIDLKKAAEQKGFNSYIDLVRWQIDNGKFKGPKAHLIKYTKFINKLDNGLDVNTSRAGK